MMHGPCGALNPVCPCMKPDRKYNVTCSKFYPKSLCEATNFALSTYPQYRRRSNGSFASINNVSIGNQWVVPYNPFLLQKYNAHINVEICSNIQVIKYVYKYFFKGHDRAAVVVNQDNRNNEENVPQNHDEISDFVDARYIAAPEALWHIQSHSTSSSSYSIILLSLHLPNQQSVFFAPGSE
jgi:hypothetical protein